MTQMMQTWPHITGIAILDIALVAIIIYQLLMLIRGTRAAPMLVGVAALALAAPVLWALFDWITAGSPTYSFTGTRETVDTLARHTGPVDWTIPLSANLVLRNLGLTLFLALVWRSFYIARLAADLRQQLQTVHARHLEIGDQQIVGADRCPGSFQFGPQITGDHAHGYRLSTSGKLTDATTWTRGVGAGGIAAAGLSMNPGRVLQGIPSPSTSL